MTHDRSDPLSTALACVRRLSDEGLESLWEAINEEQEARERRDSLAARWYTGRAGHGGHLTHVVSESSEARHREDLAGGGLAPWGLKSRCGVFLGRAKIEGEPDCKRCLRGWSRPA